MSTLNLADGESFVKGRSTAKARELLELAGDEHKASVRTVSHGYIVPSAILPEGYEAITKADLPAVTTEPGTPTNVEDVWNKGGASKDPVGTPLAEADQAPAESAKTTALATDGSNVPDGTEEQPEQPEQQKPLGEEFDPSKSTVDEVNEYLANTDAEERERVLAAEAAGKNRKGIVDAATTSEEGK